MEYNCNHCNYASYDKFNFNRHLNSKKHTKNVHLSTKDSNLDSKRFHEELTKVEKYVCKYCDIEYSSSSNLTKHSVKCTAKNKLLSNYITTIKDLESKLRENNLIIENKEHVINYKDEIISILKSEVAHLKSVVNNSGSIVKTSVSTMAYVIKNFKDAPVLEMINDYSKLHNEQDNISFIEELIHQYDHQKLDIYIGNFIIKSYKKEDPTKQSIWNSDTNRLTYLIRELLNNKVDWKVDKKGIKTKQFIIEPILEYIDEQLRNYIQNFTIEYETVSAKDAEKKMMKIKSVTEIIKQIEDKVLCEQILKYIAPYFYLNKTDDNIIEL
jgi:hypothetical protein